jgi:hypothetical protein
VNGVSQFDHSSDRYAYMFHLMLARKFSEKLSLQINPMFIHYNLVLNTTDKNDIYALAGSGRYKVSRRIAITGEYILHLGKYVRDASLYTNSASIGMDIETGGHVFQLFVTNSQAINEVQLVPFTNSFWKKGEIRFGFNISRVFSLKRVH